MRDENRNTHASAQIKQMTEEIYRLVDEQAKALKSATFLGMTTNEANECDLRSGRIQRLIGAVERLQKERTVLNE